MTVITTLGFEFLVNTNTGSDQFDPAVTGLANGNFLVTWYDASGTLGDSGGTSIKAQMFSATGTAIGTEFLVNTQKGKDQIKPVVTDLANGGFVVTWTDSSGTLGDASGSSIKAQVYSATGAKVGSEFLVNTQTAGAQSGSTVTSLANGGFVVSWTDASVNGDGSGTSVKAQLFTATGAKTGSEFVVNTATANNQEAPTITSLANGSFVVSWTGSAATAGDTSGSAIHAQLFTATGAKSGGEILVNTATGGNQNQASITGLSNGGFVVTWTDNSQTGGDTSLTSVRAQIFGANGAPAGAEFLVNTLPAGNQYTPSVTKLEHGGFVVAWYDFSGGLGDTSFSGIAAQAFTDTGVKIGQEFRVNTQTMGGQFNPALAGLANGNFVATWQDGGAVGTDSSGFSIKAQIFSVLDVIDDFAPVIGSNGGGDAAALTVGENGTAVTTVAATDGDAGAALTYSISGGADAALFTINAMTGVLSFKTAPNFEAAGDAGTDNVYDVVVRASDGILIDEQAIAVTVTNVGEAGGYIGTSGADTYVAPDAAARTIDGLGGNDKLTGNAGADVLVGGAGNDVLDGGAGNDIFYGGIGSDTYVVDASGDRVIEYANEGTDTVKASVGFTLGDNLEKLTLTGTGNIEGTGNALNNTLTGNTGNNLLSGGAGKDIIVGGAGNDTIIGGTAADTLTGGTGLDRFVFDKVTTSNEKDTIKDFVSGEDKIAIDHIQFGAFYDRTGTSLIASDFTIGSAATADSHHIIYNNTTGALYYDPDGVGGAVQVQIALLSTKPTLVISDFVLI